MMKKDTSFCATNFDDTTKLSRKFRAGSTGNPTVAPQIRAAAFETLEDRRLMSAALNYVSLINGQLLLQGSTTQSSSITVNLINNGTQIDASADHNHVMIVPRSSVSSIQIAGGSGNDYVFVDQNLTVPVTIFGGDGNDQIRGGGGTNNITVGSGNDWISGHGSSNVILAGDGNDTINGGSGSDTIVAGDGNNNIIGAGGNDSISVGDGNNYITGGTGNVVITAGNGKDSIAAGHGVDRITLGTGVSTVYAGSGSNTILLGNTKDTIVNYGGKNTVTYGSQPLLPVTPPVTPVTPVTPPKVVTPAPTPTPTPVATPTPTPTPAPVQSNGGSIGTTNWSTYSAPTSSTGVRAVMQILAPAPTVGIAIVVRALNSTLGVGSPITSNYQWSFGDPNGAFNTLPGFNAAHIYNAPGTYPITLTVTNYLHQTSTVTMNITIKPDTRRMIYVNSQTGNDGNNGSTAGQAVKSAARADQLVGNNTEVLFARGQQFNLSAAFKLNFTNVFVTAYGSGANPIINYTTPGTGTVIFTTNSHSAAGVTVSNMTLNSVAVSGKAPPMGVMAGGFDTSVVGCTFLNVEYDINASSAPVGLTAINNSSPVNGDLAGYFIWDQGTDTTVLGNYVNGSTNEHVLRTTGASELLIYCNDFNNYDGKGCIEIHVGGYAWIDSNTVNGGDIRVGPLALWGEPIDTTSNCVIQANTVTNTDITVYPGAQHISIRNNVITRADKQLIDIQGENGQGWQATDIQILNNTGNLTGANGNFLKVENHTQNILLENNLLIAPYLTVGANNTAPVYVAEGNLGSFTFISGNVWQAPKFYAYAQGGVNFIATSSTSNDYVTPSVWNSFSNVGDDYFTSTGLVSGTYTPLLSSLAHGLDLPVAGLFTNYYGAVRSSTGRWSAGAV